LRLTLLRSLRIVETLPFCGIVLLGGLFSWRQHGWGLGSAWLFAMAAAFFLTAATFAFNDLMDREDDRRSGLKAERPLVVGALTTRAAVILVTALAACGLVLLAAGCAWHVLAVGASMLLVGSSYSLRGAPLKAVPVLSSLAHVVFGVQTYLLGAWSVAGPDACALPVGLYFGLVFAAGHLHHEVADLDADRRAGVRTHAVRFGPRKTLVAGLLVWLLSGATFSVLALTGVVPAVTGWIQLAMLSGYLAGFLGILRGRFDPGRLRRLRTCYRLVYAAGGLAMTLALVL
jgi:4-hydroxybenzoate polyprenyltransferase